MKHFTYFILALALLFNNISFAQTSFGSAVDFDGYGDYANTLNDPYFPTTDGTLEAWVKVRSITAQIGNVFFEKNEEQWNQGDFYIYFETASGKIKARVQSYPSSPPIQADIESDMSFWNSYDMWIHVAFSWGSNGMMMYINGDLQTNHNSVTNSAMNNTYNFYVGADGYMLHNGNYVVSNFFDGQIDEARIWNHQRTSEQIISLWDAPLDSSYFASLDSGLVGYWQFNELEDLGVNNDGVDDVRDYSVLQNHLDLSGNAHLVPSNIVPVDPDIFEKTFGGVSSEMGVDMEITDDNGFIIGGSTSSFSNQDMYLIKLDSTGTLEWSKVYHSNSFIDRLHDVKQTSDGGYYLVGYIEGGFGFLDHSILKVDPQGNLIWAKNFGGIEADELRGISITTDGGALVSGYNASFGAGLKDVQVIKFISDGSVEWAKNFGTIWEDHNLANIIATNGDFIFCGATDISGNLDWRPTLIKTDTLGNILWAKYYPGVNDDWSRDLIEAPDGGFFIVGETRSYGLGGSEDIYLVKTTINGDVEWAKAYGGISNESGRSIYLTSDNKIIIAGFTSSFGFGGYDAFLMKLNLDGSLVWFHTYGGYTNDYANSVKETPDLGYALTGQRSTNTIGSDDVYLIKTDQDGNSPCDFGIFSPNVFAIPNLQAINLNMSTSNVVSVSDLSLTVFTPNTAENISCSIIPVELKSFNYQLEKNDVVLKWTTVTEINNMGFKIFRNRIEIGFVPGSGTSTELRAYLFRDENIENGNYLYSLVQIDYDGTTEKVGGIEVVVENTPTKYSLQQNYPNPFNPTTTINYTLPEESNVTLSIYDVLGNKVTMLVNSHQQAGAYNVVFNGSNLSSGVYFYLIKAGEFTAVRKLVLMK